MTTLFIAVLNMSITASIVALAVILVRQFLQKTPKIFSYALWAVVLFRLVCPVSFESGLSLIPTKPAAIPRDIVYSQNPAINSGIGMIDNTVNHTLNSSLPPVNPASSANPLGIVLEIAAFNWLLGIAVLLSYGAVTYFKLRQRLFTATLCKDNIFETDLIQTPFVLGFIKPKIYIPTGIAENELTYIIKHEQTHIRRRDYLIKPAAFLALTLHWFNPLIWLCYLLMVKDMEMSCDESVLKQSGEDIRVGYSNSLLSLSVKRSGLLSPLAFGESNIIARIKNILNYKKAAIWVVVVAIIAVAAVAVVLVSNPQPSAITGEKSSSNEVSGADEPIETIVEKNLSVILSSPQESSNPQDYIKAHQDEYENIKKLGGEEALQYMLAQFAKGNNNDLRGQIMMALCKELLGVRNNVTDQTLSPQEWFSALSIRQEIKLPDFVYAGNDPIEKLVYATEVAQNTNQRGFTVVAPKIFGSYAEGTKLKVFVTTYSATYRLYDKTLSQEGGGVVPAAITYTKDAGGNYVLEEYKRAMDGSYFAKSIRQYCTMPVSGKEIAGLADKILNHYGNYEDIRSLHRENLIKHLQNNQQTDVTLYSRSEEILLKFNSEIAKVQSQLAKLEADSREISLKIRSLTK